MDYETYRKNYFVDPPPQPRFNYAGINGVALYYQAYESAIQYYTQVLGPPVYVEGKHTHGWRIGNSWLTIFPAKEGGPRNAEMHIYMESPAEAERLQAAFVAAGGQGEPPTDALMFEPVRFCSVTDPFGTTVLIIGLLDL